MWMTEEVRTVQHNSPAAVAVRQVAGQEPAVVQNFFAQPRRIQVAGKHAGAAQGELARFAIGQRLHRFVHNHRFKTGHGPANGFGMFRRFGECS